MRGFIDQVVGSLLILLLLAFASTSSSWCPFFNPCLTTECGKSCIMNPCPTTDCNYHVCKETGQKIQSEDDVRRVMWLAEDDTVRKTTAEALFAQHHGMTEKPFCDDWKCWSMRGETLYRFGNGLLMDKDGKVYFWDIRCD